MSCSLNSVKSQVSFKATLITFSETALIFLSLFTLMIFWSTVRTERIIKFMFKQFSLSFKMSVFNLILINVNLMLKKSSILISSLLREKSEWILSKSLLLLIESSQSVLRIYRAFWGSLTSTDTLSKSSLS